MSTVRRHTPWQSVGWIFAKQKGGGSEGLALPLQRARTRTAMATGVSRLKKCEHQYSRIENTTNTCKKEQ